MHRAGYMLTEMCIVLFLFALICSCAVTTFNNMQILTTRSQVLLLQSTIRHAQWNAISSGKQQTVLFNTQAHSYQYQKETFTLPKPLRFGATPTAKGPPAHPTTVIKEPISFANTTIVCFPSGAVSSGSVYITDGRASFALSNAVSYFAYLRLYKYHNNRWMRI